MLGTPSADDNLQGSSIWVILVVFVGGEGEALAVLSVAGNLVALVACQGRRLSYGNKCPKDADGACRVILYMLSLFIL